MHGFFTVTLILVLLTSWSALHTQIQYVWATGLEAETRAVQGNNASQLSGQSLLAHCSHVNPAAAFHDVFQFINLKIVLIFSLLKSPWCHLLLFIEHALRFPSNCQLLLDQLSAHLRQLSKHTEGRGLCSCWLGRAVWNPVYWLEIPTSAVGVVSSHGGWGGMVPIFLPWS